MKTLTLILLLALIGCSRSESPAQKASKQIQQWIPTGTSLASARQIVEQHGFTCSTISYDSMKAITNDPDAIQWTKEFILKHQKTEVVTNISVLKSVWTDSKNQRSQCSAGWVVINDKTMGLMWWTVSK
jgi:hypothetical protein